MTEFVTDATRHLAADYWNSQPEPDMESPNPAMRVWGWMSPTELEWLADTAAQMDSVVEVGSLHGRSAVALLSACDGPVYCIDPWNDPGYHCIGSFMRSCGHYPNLRAIVGKSPDVIETYHLPAVDMVFIDGAHDVVSVTKDIDGWLSKTRRIMCGHDYIPGGGFPDVAVVVDRVFGERVRVVPGTAIWYVLMDQPPRIRPVT